MRSVVSSKEYVEFYQFWAWEYAKRNPDYRKYVAQIEQIEELAVGEGDASAIEVECSDRFGYSPSAFDWSPVSSTEILECILRNEKLPSHMISRAGLSMKVRALKFREKEKGRRVVESEGQKWEDYDALVAIDLSASNESILQELDLLRGILGTIEANERGESAEFRQEDEYLIARFNIQARKSVSFDPGSPQSRAVGLWLWDSIYGELDGRPPKHGAIIEAIRAFKSQFDYAALGYAASESDVFRKLIRCTVNCIDKAEVLRLM